MSKAINIFLSIKSAFKIRTALNDCIYHINLPLKQVYENLFNKKDVYIEFIFGAGAQFIVSKKKILEKPKEFYLKIIQMLENSIDPTEGYVIERFHKLMFC
jgi:hypothetical protein